MSAAAGAEPPLPGRDGSAAGAPDGPQDTAHLTPGGKPSGLRDPERAVRGLGSGTLVLEVIVLLLAIQPIRVLTGGLSGAALVTIVVAVVTALSIAGLLRHRFGWWLGLLLQVALVMSGLPLHWIISAVGVVFGLVWLYVLHVRESLA